MSDSLIIKPRISEQTYALSSSNVFVFDVPVSANKQQVKAAIQTQYDVTVLKLTTSVLKGKAKASNRKGQRAIIGRRKDTKKAFATLKEGDRISVFEELE